MRLSTCIALELVVGLGSISGVVYGAGLVVAYAGSLSTSEAVASPSTVPTPSPAVIPFAPIPRVALVTPAVPAPVAVVAVASVFGASDDELLGPLRDQRLVKVKSNQGGTSLSLRLDFANGARAAFKPEQIFEQSDPRNEIAAYRMDRLLGLGHVPPAMTMTFAVDTLIAASGSPNLLRRRFDDEAVTHAGAVLNGVASWWIPEIIPATVDGFDIDGSDGIVTWMRYLRAGAERPADRVAYFAQLSRMILFDFIVDDVDRWSGGNIKTSPDRTVVYFMDNSFSFSRNGQGHDRVRTYLRRTSTFSRRLVSRLRTLTREDIVEALHDIGPLAPLLGDEQIDAILARRDYALGYIDEQIARRGDDAVLAFP